MNGNLLSPPMTEVQMKNLIEARPFEYLIFLADCSQDPTVYYEIINLRRLRSAPRTVLRTITQEIRQNPGRRVERQVDRVGQENAVRSSNDENIRRRREEEDEENSRPTRRRRMDGIGINKSNRWISFVKQVQKAHNISYREALKVASSHYQK